MRLGLTAFLARDYDEAINWFRVALGWVLLEDTDQGGGKRWVRMAPHEAAETQFLIARAVGDQILFIGKHAGGRVGYFLYCEKFEAKRAAMEAAGITFEESTRHEPYGKVAVFQDLYGNRWDLIEPAG